MRKLGCIWICVAVMAATLCATAQSTSKPDPPKMMAKDADPDWELATVKPSDPSDTRGQHIDVRGRHIVLLDTTLDQFLLFGYGVQSSQLADEPEWAKTQRWDVDGIADAEGTPAWSQVQGLIRKILAERFGLRLHHEQREMSVFALTLARGGPKILANTSDPNGLMIQRNGNSNGRHVEDLKNASMADLAEILQFHVDRPVVDQTGLKGRFDLKLQWTLDEAETPAPGSPPGLFTAMQDQVGLKLERLRAPADVLVIDRVERAGAN